MTAWKPNWVSGNNATPRTDNYAWEDPDTGERFSLDIDSWGLIRVINNDWLSKYSMAIYGDTDIYAWLPPPNENDVYPRYIRIDPKDSNNKFSEISNIDLVYEGENILHVDTFIAFIDWYVEKHSESLDVSVFLEPDHPLLTATSKIGLGVVTGLVSIVATPFPALAGVIIVATQGRSLYKNLQNWGESGLLEKDCEELFANLHSITAWVYGKYEDVAIPSTTETSQEYSNFVPNLPFKVPEYVADPDVWYTIHFDKPFLNLNVENRLGILKNTWEQIATNVSLDMVQEFNDATVDVTTSTFGITKEEYRRQLRSVKFLVPGEDKKRELPQREFFSQLLKASLDKISKGRSAPYNYLKAHLNQYVIYYNIPL